jgi:RND family efflux transporter MFP subunit
MKFSRRAVLLAVLVLLAGAGGLAYFIRARQSATTTEESAPQTAAVRQGDLVISASGTGSLAASEEIELGFKTGGQVTGVFVKPGDCVEAGTLLAQVDSTEAQTNYAKAKQNYLELTSPAAIASAQDQLAQAQADLDSAMYQLEYLISPDVLYWETEIEEGEQVLEEARARLEETPSDKDVQQALAKAEAFLDFAQDMLKEAWELYYEEYVPDTFPIIEDRNDKDVYAVPTDLEILQARIAIDEARKQLEESQDLYDVLTGGPMPEDASSDALIELQQAERDLQNAQAALDGTKIFAPISGTILSVDTSTGNTIDTDTDEDEDTGTKTIIVMADLSQPVLEIYLDETDWELVAVGNPVEITFDALPDRIITGQVTQLDTKLYQSGNTSVITGTVQLDSALDEIGLPIGANASVEVIHAQVEDAVLVPIEALHETSPGEYAVFVVENDKLSLRTVEIGLQDQLYAEVKSGLKAGDVVSTGLVKTN